jgi:hypothetical protein
MQIATFLVAIALSGCAYYTRNEHQTINRGGYPFHIHRTARVEAFEDETDQFQSTVTFPDGTTATTSSYYASHLAASAENTLIDRWLAQHGRPGPQTAPPSATSAPAPTAPDGAD